MKKIFIILICILIASPAFAGKPKKSPLYKLQKQLGNGEMISLPSYSTTSFMWIHEGGDHGKEFMPEYLKFWKDNLL